jgi:hypothetical protein
VGEAFYAVILIMSVLIVGSIALDIAAGARRVAIVSGMLKASDITAYARAAKRLLASSFACRVGCFSLYAVIRHSSF